jgi:hypothetical protein
VREVLIAILFHAALAVASLWGLLYSVGFLWFVFRKWWGHL